MSLVPNKSYRVQALPSQKTATNCTSSSTKAVLLYGALFLLLPHLSSTPPKCQIFFLREKLLPRRSPTDYSHRIQLLTQPHPSKTHTHLHLICRRHVMVLFETLSTALDLLNWIWTTTLMYINPSQLIVPQELLTGVVSPSRLLNLRLGRSLCDFDMAWAAIYFIVPSATLAFYALLYCTRFSILIAQLLSRHPTAYFFCICHFSVRRGPRSPERWRRHHIVTRKDHTSV